MATPPRVRTASVAWDAEDSPLRMRQRRLVELSRFHEVRGVSVVTAVFAQQVPAIRGCQPHLSHRYPPDRRQSAQSPRIGVRSSRSPAELCCDTLLIDDGTRHRSYCLLLLSHVDVDERDVRERAVIYGLEDEIDALFRYLETQGEINDDRFPEWDKFQELAADYEVRLS